MLKITENPIKNSLQIKSDIHFESYQIIDNSGKLFLQKHFEKEINVSQ